MLRLLVLICALLASSMAHAQDHVAKILNAFSLICSAAIDQKPDIEAIAASVNMGGPGGTQFAMTFGKTSLRTLVSTETKQLIFVTTSTYADAQEIECKSIVPFPTPRPELEGLVQSLKLDGQFLPVPGTATQTTGRWKRAGNDPPVFVTMMSTNASSILTMQRIDLAKAAPESSKAKSEQKPRAR